MDGNSHGTSPARPGGRRLGRGWLALLAVLACLGIAAGGAAASVLDEPGEVLAGEVSLQAQRICNGVFVTGLAPARYEHILYTYNESRVQLKHPEMTWTTKIDRKRKEVTISGTGGGLPAPVSETVKRVPEYGCVPLYQNRLRFTPGTPRKGLPAASVSARTAWPLGEKVVPYKWRNQAGERAVGKDVAKLFTDPGQFGFALSYRGHMIYEHYAPGLGPSSAADGYSITKSLIATEIGALIQKGWLKLSEPGGLPSWRKPGDPRGKVTVEDLLRMESGLSFPETQPDGSPGFAEYVTNALAATEIPGNTYARLDQLQVQTKPGGQSHYLNANYQLLAARASEVLAKHGYNPDTGFYQLVFDKLDMSSLEFRADAFGNLAGPRHAVASARDWTKLGLLYAQKGSWNGEQILPRWWSSFVSSSSGRSDGGPDTYGAGFWLTVSGNYVTEKPLRNQPKDAFFCNGAEFQYVAIWPKEHVVMTITSDGTDSKVPIQAFAALSGVVLRLERAGKLG